MKSIAHSSKLYYHYLKRTGLFEFLWSNLKKLGIIVGILVVIAIVIQQVVSFEAIFAYLSDRVHHYWMFGIFFLTETFFGLFPPDIFILWIKPLAPQIGVSQWSLLWVLGLLSYLGGLAAYLLGFGSREIPLVQKYILQKNQDMVVKLKKWGGFLIAVAAILPIPYSLVTFLSGMVKFPFKVLLWVGLLRFLRYFLYAIILWQLM